MERVELLDTREQLVKRATDIEKVRDIRRKGLATPLAYRHQQTLSGTFQLTITEPYHNCSLSEYGERLQEAGLAFLEEECLLMAKTVLEAALTTGRAGLPLPRLGLDWLFVTNQGHLTVYPLTRSPQSVLHPLLEANLAAMRPDRPALLQPLLTLLQARAAPEWMLEKVYEARPPDRLKEMEMTHSQVETHELIRKRTGRAYFPSGSKGLSPATDL
jgi:hypothetical protein